MNRLSLDSPSSLEVLASRLLPGAPLRLQDQEMRVAGLVSCQDAKDGWLEAYLRGTGSAMWLVIEHRRGRAGVTMWQRATTDCLPTSFVTARDPQMLVGTANFWAIGSFGGMQIPPRGTLQYFESFDPHRTAERFGGGRWLLGREIGREAALTSISAQLFSSEVV
ncbi:MULTISPECIES: hypothetical protein [unclassified Leucobacter]|uniref:hypothetical protein n=1 Tax=unclassified Leucobacter TaxID=2621730 RepID=UPI003017C85D